MIGDKINNIIFAYSLMIVLGRTSAIRSIINAIGIKTSFEDKILFFDTDTYFNKSPLPLFDLIKANQDLV